MAEAAVERRVVIAGGEAGSSGAWPGDIVQLTHPQTGEQAAFLLRGDVLQELHWYRPEFGSWFAGDTVISGGGLCIGSPVDPLFLALPALERGKRQASLSAAKPVLNLPMPGGAERLEAQGGAAEGDGVFQDAEQLLRPVFGRHTDALSAAVESNLAAVCECKSVEGLSYWRLNEARALAWLSLKAARVSAALRGCGGVYSGMDDQALAAYAAGVVGEYLDAGWLARLRAFCQLDEPGQPAEAPLSEAGANQQAHRPASAPAEKKPRLDPKQLSRQRAAEAREEKRAAQLRRETRGMKKMSSFFVKSKPAGA